MKPVVACTPKQVFNFSHVNFEVHLRFCTWKTTRMQRMMQVSPLTMAFSIMSQMLLRWWASMGCCLPKKLLMGRLLLAARRLSWWMHMAPTWCSNWLMTSFVVVASPGRRGVQMLSINTDCIISLCFWNAINQLEAQKDYPKHLFNVLKAARIWDLPHILFCAFPSLKAKPWPIFTTLFRNELSF